LPSPRRPPINASYITAVGITSPAASISSNTLTASSIRPLLHHQRSPWRVRVDVTVFLHLAQKPRYAPPVLAQELGVACFGLAASLPYTTEPRAFLARVTPAAVAYARPPPGSPRAGSCCSHASPCQTAAPELHLHAPPVPKLFPRPEPTRAGFPIATSRVCGGNHGKGRVLATPAMERRPQPLLHRFARRSCQSSSPTPATASNHAPRAVAPTPNAAPLACAKSSSRTPHQPSAAAPPLLFALRAATTWIAPKPSRPAPARPRAPTPASL
jgi:hypothetical protein